MLQHHISGLPVIDKTGKLVGILSEGDFLRRRETRTDRRPSRWLEFLMGPGKMAAEYTHTHGSKVYEVMTTEVHTVNEDTPLEKIVELMEKRRIKRVPVLHGNKVVGIVTRSNLMHAMVSLARAEPNAAKDDATIRQKLLAELKKEKWALASMINVVVRGGVVELWGAIVDERQREALKVAAENIPGVKEVKDHLAWVETEYHRAERRGCAATSLADVSVSSKDLTSGLLRIPVQRRQPRRDQQSTSELHHVGRAHVSAIFDGGHENQTWLPAATRGLAAARLYPRSAESLAQFLLRSGEFCCS